MWRSYVIFSNLVPVRFANRDGEREFGGIREGLFDFLLSVQFLKGAFQQLKACRLVSAALPAVRPGVMLGLCVMRTLPCRTAFWRPTGRW